VPGGPARNERDANGGNPTYQTFTTGDPACVHGAASGSPSDNSKKCDAVGEPPEWGYFPSNSNAKYPHSLLGSMRA
jgi:hypothetical protein